MDASLGQAIQALVLAKPTWAVISLIGLNFILGVINALKDGRFTFYEVADIAKKVAPIAITYFAIGVSSEMALTEQLANTINTLVAVVAGLPFLASSLKEANALRVPVNKLLGPALTKAIASKPTPGSKDKG